jgi:hypothetical protein
MNTWLGPRGVPIYSSIPMNIDAYIHRRYISQFLHWLTDKYNVYSSVINVCLSVITKERYYVSCSDIAMLVNKIILLLPFFNNA